MSVDAADRASPLHRDDFTTLGPYRLVGRLGAGGMGVVYLGVDERDRYVAIKLVHARLADDPEFSSRFRSEVERARAVPAFCTAEVLDANLDHNPPYLVVEYVDGPSLAQTVHERGPLSPSHLHSVAVGVATALTGIHAAGVIHRDLKPENVLLAPGSPKVIDFGIARAFEVTSEHTRTGQWVGTVSYMAPERFSARPGTPLTPAADIFAWGCVVGFAGTGRTPFQGDSPEATAARILTQPPYLDGLAEPLRGLVEAAVAKDQADRPTARELLDLLVSGPGLAGPRSARVRAAGLPPAVAAFLPPTDPRARVRNAAPDSRVAGNRPAFPGLRPEVAAFLNPAPDAPPAGHPAAAAPTRDNANHSARAKPVVPRQHGLRPEVAAFLESPESGPEPEAPETPSSPAPIHATPAGHSAPRTAPALPVQLPGWLTDRLHSVRGLTMFALVVLAIVAVIGGGVWAGGKLVGSHRNDDAAGSQPPAQTFSTLSGTAEPTGGVLNVTDPLTRPGGWVPSKSGAGQCAFDGSLRAMRTDRVEHGEYRCSGPATSVADDFGVKVTTTLNSASSCAGIWFHASSGTDGQMLRVCPGGISLFDETGSDVSIIDTFREARPIALKTAAVIHMVVQGKTVSVWQDGVYAGAVMLDTDTAVSGQVQLGISVEGGDEAPPYSVTFTGLDIRSL
jgi:eukaryotic-like serine/threonine-protein kinase